MCLARLLCNTSIQMGYCYVKSFRFVLFCFFFVVFICVWLSFLSWFRKFDTAENVRTAVCWRKAQILFVLLHDTHIHQISIVTYYVWQCMYNTLHNWQTQASHNCEQSVCRHLKFVVGNLRILDTLPNFLLYLFVFRRIGFVLSLLCCAMPHWHTYIVFDLLPVICLATVCKFSLHWHKLPKYFWLNHFGNFLDGMRSYHCQEHHFAYYYCLGYSINGTVYFQSKSESLFSSGGGLMNCKYWRKNFPSIKLAMRLFALSLSHFNRSAFSWKLIETSRRSSHWLNFSFKKSKAIHDPLAHPA